MAHLLRGFGFRILFAMMLCAAAHVFVYAQSTTDGAIGGTVVDQQKAIVPNVVVTVRSNETNKEDRSTTDDAGGFRVVQLRPGTYTVTVNVTGFAPFKQEKVIVEVGRVTSLDITLALAGSTTVVEVTGEVPVVDTAQQDFAHNLNETSINELPINGRRWSNFALLTPGATPDGNFGLISFRGISGLLNNSTVDGGDNNQAFFSEERGRTRISYVISQAAIKEFQVNTANYSAEYGRAAGGVVNAVTKSGSNAFHGSAFYYIRDNAVGATNPFTVQSVLVGGVATTVPLKPEDRRHQFGATLGGPLVKDKVFFFFSYDQQKRNFPGVAAPQSPTFLNPITVPGLTQAQVDAGLAYLRSLTGVVPRTGDQYIILPKVDWNITPKNTFSANYNRLHWNSPAGIQTQPVVTRGRTSFGDDFVRVDSVNARLVSTLSARVVNEVRFQFGRDNEFQNSQTPAPGEPTTGIGGRPPQVEINPGGGGITIGKPDFLERRALPDELRWQTADSLTLSIRKHLIKLGGEYNRVKDLQDNLFQEGGVYAYSSLTNFLRDWANPGVKSCGGPPPAPLVFCYDRFSQAFGQPASQFATTDYSFFIQDAWHVVPRLTVNLGLRYEYESLPSPQLPNILAPQTLSFPKNRNNFGPRVGFAWDLTGNGKTSLRGGYGIYYGRIINSTIANALTNTGMPGGQAQVSMGPAASGAPAYPNVLPSGAPPPSRDIVVFSPSMANPLIHQADVIFEREILRNTVVSASYLLSLGRRLPTFIDINLNPPTATITYKVTGGPLDGQSFTMPKFTGPRPNPNFARILEIRSAIESRYDAFVLQVNRRFTGGLQFQNSYTLARATDTGQGSQTFTSPGAGPLNPFDLSLDDATSSFEIRHRFVSSVVWSPEFFKGQDRRLARALLNGYTISPIVSVASGRPFTGSVSGSAPGGLSSGILGAGGSSRPPFIARNAFRYPRTVNVDLRLSRRFRITESSSVEILAEAFNLFNHVNVTELQTRLYGIAVVPGENRLQYNSLFGNPTAAGNTLFRERQIQFAARFTF